MNFSLTPDQELLRDTGRALVREHCPSSVVRAYVDDPTVADPLSTRLAEFAGLVSGPAVDLCLFLEEMGAALVPGPFVPTVAAFAPVVAAIGDDALLARVANGEVTGTVASAPPLELLAPDADRVDMVAILDDAEGVALVERPAADLREPFDLSRRSFDVRLSPR
ncbi:MAG: hypothetical protein WEA75_13900, partial [Acidimicrobiia bacterium]